MSGSNGSHKARRSHVLMDPLQLLAQGTVIRRVIFESTLADFVFANGRFKGGWTTRHHGNPQTGYHAIKMELAQCNYMEEKPPWDYDVKKAEKLRVTLASIFRVILELRL